MLWLPLAIGSYFLSALSSTVDKILLRERIPQPAAYAFYSGLLSVGVIIILPFYLVWGVANEMSWRDTASGLFLPWETTVLSLFAGALFVPALYFFYIALKRCDVSRIVPIIGGMTPIVLMVLFYIFEGTVLSIYQLLATLLFLFGGFILATEVMCEDCVDSFGTHLLGIRGHRLQICGIETSKGMYAALAASVFFALTYFLSAYAYQAPTPFLSEFVWMRLGSILGALCMLAIPFLHHDIMASSHTLTRSSSKFLIGNKVVGALSFFLLNASFNIGPIITINALKGFEYFFVFCFTIAFSLFYPKALRESFDEHTIILKLLAIVLISFGFLFLIYSS